MEEILDDETHQVNVFYDFEAGADDELSLSAGDMVTVLGTVGDEWIKGLWAIFFFALPSNFLHCRLLASLSLFLFIKIDIELKFYYDKLPSLFNKLRV